MAEDSPEVPRSQPLADRDMEPPKPPIPSNYRPIRELQGTRSTGAFTPAIRKNEKGGRERRVEQSVTRLGSFTGGAAASHEQPSHRLGVSLSLSFGCAFGYAITLPCLVAILECALRTFAPDGTFASTKIEGAESVTVSVWASVLAFVTWFYEQYEAGKASDDRIFRHGLQHDTQPPPNEKAEPLRLFHALDIVTILYIREEV
jgi:hypothetical protein